MRSPYYATAEMARETREATLQIHDDSMPVKQIAITLISRRKQNVLRIVDPVFVSEIVEFLKQHYQKGD